MRKAYKYILPATLAIMTLAGCASEGNEPTPADRSDCPAFTATIGSDGSRAIDRAWERGDQIGVSGCGRANVCYVTAEGDSKFAAKNAGDQIYFEDDREATFTAYYPWSSQAATSISADTKNQTAQKSFDFLWATGKGKKDAPNVGLSFDHKMSKLSLTVHPGTAMSFAEIKAARMSLKGLSHTGTFNISDGKTAVGAPAGAWTFTEFARFNEADQTVTFSFILFPQTFSAPLDFTAHMETPGSNPFTLSAGIDFTEANRQKDGTSASNEWVGGRQYNLSLTLNKTGVTLNECVINGWNEVTGTDISVD